MAISAAVFVGGIGPWRDALTAKAKSLKVGRPTGITAYSSRSTCSFRKGSPALVAVPHLDPACLLVAHDSLETLFVHDACCCR
jgi:hypothetical protein